MVDSLASELVSYVVGGRDWLKVCIWVEPWEIDTVEKLANVTALKKERKSVDDWDTNVVGKTDDTVADSMGHEKGVYSVALMAEKKVDGLGVILVDASDLYYVAWKLGIPSAYAKDVYWAVTLVVE